MNNTAPRWKEPAQAQSDHAKYEPTIGHSDFTIAQGEFCQSAIPISPASGIANASIDNSNFACLRRCVFHNNTKIEIVQI